MIARALLLVLALVVATLAVTSVRLDSATADEGAHIAAGLIKLRHGWLSFFPEQPPLMNVLSALPLGEFRLSDRWRNDLGRGGHWRIGHELLYRSGNDAHRLLFLARLPTIALFLVLCFAVYWVVARETNRTWGMVAFALTGFCPNLLAHGRLATVDLAAAAFCFLAFVFFLRGLEGTQRNAECRMQNAECRKDAGRTAAPFLHSAFCILHSAFAPHAQWIYGALSGIFTMAAVLSKTSAVILGPFFVIVLTLHLWRTRDWRRVTRPLLAAVASGIVLLYAVTFLLASPEYLAAQYADTPRLLVPWMQYKQHVDAIRFWYEQGHEHPQFLMGEFSRTGWPHYYLVAFFLKTPLGAIVLTVLAAVGARRKRSLTLDSCLIFVVLFFAVSTTSKIALGVRYILPVYPFLYAAIAIALAHVVTEKRRAIAIGVLVAWHCVSSLVAYPSYLSYFNELIGGNRNADKFLIDSNLDWGQDLRRLRLWADANNIDHLRIAYFGGGDIAYEFGPTRAERWIAPQRRLLPKGWFALSRHFYRVSFDPQESPVDYDAYLEASKARYVTTVGGSIDVYLVD
jgi:4-amino-4-deoxy-L-arabinose transferase-like glycosyltransferase